VSRKPRQAERQALLDQLRTEIERLERGGRVDQPGPALPLGLAGIDHALPRGGLARGCLHEFCGAPEHAAAAGFAAAVLGRFAVHGAVVWIGPKYDLFAPGLAEFGLASERLIVVRAGRQEDRLWALEETLRHPGIAAGLAEVGRLGLSAGRRLQLAAETKGVSALLLRPARALDQPSAAFTRWRIAPSPSTPDARLAPRGLGAPRLRVELVRARGGRPGSWQIEWHQGRWHEVTDPLVVAADACDRPADPARKA